jgi:hypothetical protein
VLWTEYDAFLADFTCGRDCSVESGDTIIRLINPNGSANTGISAESGQPVCAMMYVFDDDQEMQECCGCPISSAGMLSFSVDYNLRDNYIRGNGDGLERGVIAVVAAAPNASITTLGSPSNGLGCTVSQSSACNFGCDPTSNPGYIVTTDNNLLGSRLFSNSGSDDLGLPGLTEIALFDDGRGDPTNLAYLQAECGQLVGNGSGGGVCSCPVPGDAEPSTPF